MVRGLHLSRMSREVLNCMDGAVRGVIVLRVVPSIPRELSIGDLGKDVALAWPRVSGNRTQGNL